jgi:hypothetical protein
MTENKPNERSDPAYTKYWLQKSIENIRKAQGAAEAQARTGGTATNPVSANKATHRFNPQTGKIEVIQ